MMKKFVIAGIMISIVMTIFVIVLFFIYLFEDYDGYEKEYKDLYTEAIYSLLGNRGYFLEGEILDDPEIIVIEEDNYGRILYAYYESNHVSSYSYLIAQKSDDIYVYFYPNYNFISAAYDYDKATTQTIFTTDEINQLKTQNDWNLPLDDSKMIHFEITSLKEKPKSKISKDTFEILLKSLAQKSNYLGDDDLYRYSEYFLTDDYGRTMYYVYGIGRDMLGEGVSPDSLIQYFHAVIIFQSDGSYNLYHSIMELTDLQVYQSELQAFKILNNWNLPNE
ncbi:hypothetical protein BK010_06715 [Tenericutes bacterium MO-XQ]|nr:hypothetical protein BK010_06715 [Tenericutes bacterium MO-XQ]